MPTWIISIFIVAGSVFISLAGLVAARRLFKPATLRKHHELAGNILAVVGTLNAVLLGLVILEAQNRFQQARNNEAAESSNIGDMRLYAEYLREPTRSAINKHVGSYVKLVRGVEWDSPPELQPNKEAVEEFHCLWHLVCEYTPRDSKEQNLQASMLSSLTQAFDERRFRITTGRNGLPFILWMVLIVGSSVTVIFTYFFMAHNIKMQALMVALLSVTLSMGILVVWVLGNPYVGDWKIRPEQFMRISTGDFPITGNSEPFAHDAEEAEKSYP